MMKRIGGIVLLIVIIGTGLFYLIGCINSMRFWSLRTIPRKVDMAKYFRTDTSTSMSDVFEEES